MIHDSINYEVNLLVLKSLVIQLTYLFIFCKHKIFLFPEQEIEPEGQILQFPLFGGFFLLLASPKHCKINFFIHKKKEKNVHKKRS